MPVAYIGQSQAKPDQVEAFKDFLNTVVASGVRSSAGCLSYQLFQSADDPARFIGVEVWESIEAHRAAVKEIDPESIRRFMELAAGPPSGGYYQAAE